MTMLGVILPLIPETNLYSFFSFKNIFELVIYVAFLVFVFIFIITMFHVIGNQLILWGRNIKINVEIKEYIQDNHKPEHISLIIKNNELDDLTDCRATLLIAEELTAPNLTRDILQIINPNDSLMSWGGGSEKESVYIPGEKGRRVLNIARHSSNGQFSFLFYSWTSESQTANLKYHVVIKITGKLNENPFRPIIYDGYFRTITNPNATRVGFEFGRYVDENKNVYEDINENNTGIWGKT